MLDPFQTNLLLCVLLPNASSSVIHDIHHKYFLSLVVMIFVSKILILSVISNGLIYFGLRFPFLSNLIMPFIDDILTSSPYIRLCTLLVFGIGHLISSICHELPSLFPDNFHLFYYLSNQLRF